MASLRSAIAARAARITVRTGALILGLGLGSPALADVSTQALESAGPKVSLSNLSLPFVPNHGQYPAEVAYSVAARSSTLFVTKAGELVHVLSGSDHGDANDSAADPRSKSLRVPHPGSKRTPGWTLVESLVGATATEIRGFSPLATGVTYFKPGVESSSMKAYGELDLGEVYPGIDVRLQVREREIERLFVVAPGTNPGAVRIALEGVQRLSIANSGDLRIATGVGELSLTRPRGWQEIDGKKRAIDLAWAVDAESIGFDVGAYDKTRTLWIDPLLQATYLGGSSTDSATVIAIDPASRDVIVAGFTSSADFPGTAGGAQTTLAGTSDNGFVARLSADLRTLRQATFLGGSNTTEVDAIAIDPASGDVLIAGTTFATDLPGTAGGAQATNAGNGDAFVARLSGNLTMLKQSTYLGGATSSDQVFSILIDAASGDVIVAGDTGSSDFPGTAGGFQATKTDPGHLSSTFVARLSGDLKVLKQATYLGGSAQDFEGGAVIDAATGDILIAGSSTSTDFPGTAGGAQPSNAGGFVGYDATLARLTGDLKSLRQATYLGGATGDETATAVAIDAATGDVIIGGYTTSSDFPGTAGGAEPSYPGASYNGFIARLTGDLKTIRQATYMGGSSFHGPVSLTIDNALGDILFGGSTTLSNFPGVAGGAQPNHAGGLDGVIARVAGDLKTIKQSTYLGGTSDDEVNGIAIDATDGDVLVSGFTYSSDFPGTAGGVQSALNGPFDAFVARLSEGLAQLILTPTSGTPQSTTIGTVFSQALQVNAMDGTSTPGAGYPVTFALPPSGPSGVFTNTGTTTDVVITDASGNASSHSVMANSIVGAFSATASAPGAGNTASYALALLPVAGAPASITATAGMGISTVVTTAYAQALQATVLDGNSIAVSGAAVTFALPTTGTSGTFPGNALTAIVPTNGNGVATSPIITANNFFGGFNATASVAGVATPASFPLTNTFVGLLSNIASGGSPQTTAVGTTFALPLLTTVMDSAGHLLGGATVNFTLPNSGASGTFAGGGAYVMVVSDGSGNAASPLITANTIAGAFNPIAVVGGSESGGASYTLTNIGIPGAPTIGTATAGDTQVRVTFTAPASDGGSAITTYTATSSPGSATATCTAPCTSITVTGLTDGVAYTFTVTATNSVGIGPASAPSNSVTPATLPGAPSIGTATAGDAQATVTFMPPASDGGSAIALYAATSSPGNITGDCSAPCTSITVTGLTDGVAYTFTVTATNSVGTGPPSAPSNSVTPTIASGSYIIETVAGGGIGDGGLASAALLSYPNSGAFDASGNLFIADSNNNRIRKVAAGTGIIATVAGNGSAAFTGDGAAATSAGLNLPYGVAVDANGNLFIADTNNNRIRKVDAATGIITTVAGNGQIGFTGDGGPAISAALSTPTSVAVDSSGNLYVVGIDDVRVRMIAAATGIISTVAGNGTNGFSGDGGLATSASLSATYGVAVDKNSNLYIADTGNNRIREVVAATGIITTVAGNGTRGFGGDNGLATAAQLGYAVGVAVDAAGNLYIADNGNYRVRAVASATGVISTVAGNGGAAISGDGGPATIAGIGALSAVLVDANENLIIVDANDSRVREVTAASGIITTLAGSSSTSFGDGSVATSAAFVYPYGTAFDSSGNLYIADSSDNRIRMVSAASGIVSTVAGNGASGFSGDGGAATNASLNFPSSVVIDSAGNLLIADSANNRIRMVAAANGVITTIAGNGLAGFSGDAGPATAASLNYPEGIASDAAGNLVVADTINSRIRRIATASGIISTVAGNGTSGFNGDGGTATSAALYFPTSVAVDLNGNLYIADTDNERIREVVASTGNITTVAGNGIDGVSGDGGPATAARLSQPDGVAVDVVGNIYISDQNNQRVRVVAAATGIISTFAGNGKQGFSGDGGAATSASLASPGAVTLDPSGNPYISDTGNGRIRKVLVATSQVPSAPTIGTATAGDAQATVTFTVPASNGGSAITSYTATSSPSGITGGCSAPCASITVTGLTNGVTYTFTVRATNAVGTGPPSAASNSATPIAAATSTTLGSSVVPSTFGQSVTFTASVVGSAPTGTVTFSDGATMICSAVTLVSGQATCTTSALAIGAHSITAVYSGDAYNAPSTSGVLTQTVNAAVTVPGAPTIGIATAGDMQVTVTFTAPASDGGSAITTYTATSLPGGTTGTCAAPCTSITVSGLTDGVAYAFTVTATNSVGTGPASAPSNGVTPAAATTTTLGSAPDPSFFGQNVTFTASVNGSVPTGTVTFSDGATPLCTAVGLVSVKGLVSATCTTAALSIGGHPITAAYSGDANNAASTSGVLTQTVNAAATLPGAPTIGTATAGDGQATVMFAAPAANGSSPITSFTATSSPGNFTGACLPKCASITVTGLTDGVAYTFTVTAANSVGTGPASAASNSVTPSQPAPYIINTIAGGSIGDGAPATTAPIAFPDGAAVDANGNLYIADTSNNRIRMVAAATGIITTVAGSGNQGFSGDGGPASSASINGPSGMAVDANGNLYFADQGNERIRMIAAATGIITTVAGSGKGGFGGDGGAATSASLDQPQGVAVDANGNLFIADTNNNRIREVVAATGIITTVAGGGNAKGTFYGDGGAATQALLYFPTGVAFDTNENLYIADSGNNRIRIVAAATGIINTIAGGGKGTFSGDGGAATAASLNAPYGVAVDASDNLYIADSSNNRIRMVAASSGIITTIAGDGTASFSGDGGAATSASLDFPVALIIDASGNVYIVDQNNCAIRKVTSVTGIITTIAGNGSPGFFGDGAAATSSGLSFPNGVAADPSGNQFIADTLDNRIRRVAVATGIITTVAGNGTRGFSGDGGAATNATLSIPKALAVDANDNLYFSDGDFRVRMVASATGTITTVAGNGTPGFGGDGGAATAASLNGVTGVAVDANHNLYIADVGNSRIRMVAAATGIITTVVGNGTRGFSGDGGIATAASLGSPYAVALDANNNLYLADRDNSRIRMVAAATGIITTIAGNGTPGSCCDGGLATSAELYDPIGVAVDATGNLYIADAKLTRIREVAAATGIITTIAGNGTAGFSGDGGLAVNAEMEVPDGVAVDGSGNLFIADTSNNRIREVFIATQRPPASITAINGSGQSAAVNSAFAVNLQSIVKDSVGTPVQGASVTFTLPAAGASGTFGGQTTATVITGAGGIATAPALTANLIIGNWTATASVVGVATPATFALTNVAGPPAAIAASAGTPQATLTTTLFPSMLDATVTDAYGNPVSGASVMFNVPLAGASGTFPGNFKTVTLPTNAAGVAATPVTANGIAGAFTATAKVGAVAPANFALTSVLRAGTAILPLSGTPQTTTVGQPYAQTLQAKVTNGAGNPIPGLTVTFTLPAGAISGTFPGNVRTFTALTDALGEVTSPVITATNRAGTFIAHASVVGVAPASFSLTNAPGAPATITATVGGQMTAVYMQFARALAARVLDNLGNAVPGQTVTFMLPATNPNATFAGGGNPVTGITNAAGIATSPLLTANAIVGAYTATATLAGVAVPANFLLTNTVGANATATIVSGTPQSTTVLMPFGQTLQVVVHDALSRPIEGVNVTFTVLGGAAAAIFAPPNVRTVVVPTDATGLAATPLPTATKIAGTYPVRATAAGIAGFLTFNLTNTPSAQTNAVSNGVGAQTAIVNQPYAKAPSVRVTDAYGNRVPNVSVTFTVPTMGATGTFAGSGSSFTIATDATGIATSPVVTANSTIGVWNVTSVVTGIVAPVNFGMRNLLDPSATITATSPPESTPKGTNFPQPLTAIVKDHLGNPITGVTVTFAMPSQALSAHFNPGNTFVMTAPTDSTGVASTVLKTIKATATPGTYSPTATIGVGAPATFSLTNQ